MTELLTPDPGAPRCSLRSLGRGEALVGTASTYRGWVLIEQPGPWGTTALTDSRLPGDLGVRLQKVAAAHALRILLIRRHGTGATSASARHCFVAYTAPGHQVLESMRLSKPTDVLDLDFAALARGETLGLDAVERPQFFVCTHGKHDVCCAERGRPIAAALSAYDPERTWECSHLGGDRFAGNLLTLPHGLYYGRLSPERAVEVARAYDAGQMDLDALRGRCAYPFPVQAAEVFLRRSLDITDVDALHLLGIDRSTEGGTDVVASRFAVGDATYAVRVAREDQPPALLSCGDEEPSESSAFRLLDIKTGR